MSKVKDPVCGMTIESASAKGQGRYAGQMVYFCSTACQASYERSHPRDPA